MRCSEDGNPEGFQNEKVIIDVTPFNVLIKMISHILKRSI